MGIFEGKTAIITGGASGIGRALAKDLTGRGAIVVLADRNASLLDQTLCDINSSEKQVVASVIDVRNLEEVRKLVYDTVSQHGRLDYMFNNAGIGVAGEAHDFSYDDWKDVIDINLYGVVNGVFSAYPVMVEQGFGHIVNTASIAGLLPATGEISYTVSKYAVVGLSNSLRVEGADLGINVSVVCPGLIDTPILTTSKMINYDREKLIKMFPKGIPPEKCARVILRGVERNRAIIMVTANARVLWLLQRVSPGFVRWIWKMAIRKGRQLKDVHP
jgi:NAD(P)-dependent dehydrogenase (short-subunit alcohol dehydrogenase family)